MSNICKNCGCDRSQHKTGNGFLFGVLVGGVLVFLFGTEKGKKILHELSREGGNALGGLREAVNLDRVEQEVDEMVSSPEDAPLTSAPPPPSQNGHNGHSPVRKFFKGIKKK